MRITGSILAKQAISGIHTQMRALEDAQRRVSTGIEVERPSDDPVAAAGILRSSADLRALEQHRSNLQTGQTRLAIEESVLDQVTNALSRARDIGASQVNDVNDARSRDRAMQEVDEIVAHLQSLANTQSNGAYVFGGQYADTAPYIGGAWNPLMPPSGATPIEIGAGTVSPTNHSAQEIFIDSDVIDSLEALSAALDLNDVTGVQNAMTRIDAAFDVTQDLLTEVGGRVNGFDMALSNLDSLEITLQTFRSDLEDADLAEAVTDLVNRQGSLEAAMLANSRILDTTLADYLR